jgi:pimeloyl-ACP methyl ester carboxylesterase
MLRLLRPALVAVAAVIVSGCRGRPPLAPTPIGNRPGGLVLRPCALLDTIPAECGTLTVFERRDRRETRLIAIPIVRVRAADSSSQPPIVWLTGGPGASNLLRPPPAFLRRAHDWVLVGYRGVDGSERLECPELAPALRAVRDLLGPAAREGASGALRACAARLTASGVDLGGFTIEEVVGDIDEARQALGYDRLHLFSGSYGTRIAQRYAQRYPGRVSRSVQQGVNPPGRFAWESAALDSVLVTWARLCRSDEWCRLQTNDLAAAIQRVAHRMPTHWGPVRIDRGAVLAAGFGMLYSTSSAPVFFRAMLAADRGDASGLALLSVVARRQLIAQEHLGDMYTKGIVDYDRSRNYANELQLDGSIMGAPLSAFLWGAMADTTSWPLPEVRPVAPPAAVTVETLLLSGDLDVATPAIYAEREQLPRLVRGRHVVVRHAGHHDFVRSQGGGYDRLVGGFFATGAVDTTGLKVASVRFDRGPSLTRWAKGIVTAGTALVVVAVGGIAMLAR